MCAVRRHPVAWLARRDLTVEPFLLPDGRAHAPAMLCCTALGSAIVGACKHALMLADHATRSGEPQKPANLLATAESWANRLIGFESPPDPARHRGLALVGSELLPLRGESGPGSDMDPIAVGEPDQLVRRDRVRRPVYYGPVGRTEVHDGE
jgi:hypothetical protein